MGSGKRSIDEVAAQTDAEQDPFWRSCPTRSSASMHAEAASARSPKTRLQATPNASAVAVRRVALGSSLTIAETASLKSALMDLLASSGPVVFDAVNVERADTAGIQLLLAFIHAARRHGLELSWGPTSEALLGTASCLGLSQVLGLNSRRQ